MSNNSRTFLSNVAIIRPILIVLMVFYHAFAVYGGGWKPLEGFPEVKAYWWLDWLSYAFMLEMFVFLSGYVFGFQVRTKGEKKLESRSLFWGKFRRLIIPSIVFSLLYIVLLQDISQSLLKTLYDLIVGVAHMWFLPMLFLCFAGVWIIEKLKLRSRHVIPLLLLCSLCSFPSLPLRIGYAMYYLLFFYVGYIMQRKNVDLDRFCTPLWIFGFAISFIIIFPPLTLFMKNVKEILISVGVENQYALKMMKYFLSNVAQILYSSVGLSALFLAVGYIEKKRTSALPQWFVNVGVLCMGVYIFQQFILKVLYNHSNLPSILGPYWLPWVGFIAALSFSLLLSYLLRKLRVGRFLIG